MNMLLRLILAEPAYRALNQRYQRYADHNVSRFTAGLTCLLICLGWIFLRLESTGWRAVRSNCRYWFPHIYPSRPRLADPVRYLLQGAWLLLFYPVEYRRPEKYYRFFARFESLTQRYRQYIKGLAARLSRLEPNVEASEEEARPVSPSRKALLWIMSLFAVTLAVLCISQPFDLQAQFIFVLLLWSIAMLIRNIPGRLPAMMMIVLSLTISSRYMWWRYSSTLNWDDPVSLVCGLILLAAETYAWLVLILGYFQTIWPLHRQPAPMPPDITQWPDVDILIPTYNEDLDVVKPTIYASLGIDWPKEKLHIYILDDGSRPEFKAFAEQVQVGYVTREKHDHAKAGNINNALKNHVKSEFVAIFDCDHVPTRSFLQLSMGWFIKEKKLGMLQTPHHFFSPDPFERNLGRFRKMPNEGTLFYGLVQDGNDMWDATFFCGSCAVLRRSVLDEIGGIAVETVTEDAHTSLKMHRRGYTSAYIRIPQAAGLATESLSAHIGQRIRWARGMVQIFRLDNPLLGKGLKLSQRLCYFNAMLHFLSGIPRLIFLTAPLAFLLLHAYIIYAPGLAIALYVLPHMIHASLTNSRIQGKYRHSFWGEIYETVLAWYIARPTTVALLNPHIGKFNVTAKGGLIEDAHFDWTISRPYLILILLNAIGLAAGLWRLFYGPENEIFTVLLNMVWVLYNLLILGGAVAVAIEAKQIRKNHRVEMSMPAAIATNDGHLYSCTLRDYSEEGIGIEMLHPDILKKSDQVSLLLRRGQQEFAFPIKVIYASQYKIGARLSQLSVEQHIDFIQCTFARADTWALWQDGFEEDKPLESLKDVLQLGFRGYQGLGDYTPPFFKPIFKTSTSLISWVLSITPHSVGTNPVNAGQKTIFQH
jgi:cellulose synthase (UDP-forming)